MAPIKDGTWISLAGGAAALAAALVLSSSIPALAADNPASSATTNVIVPGWNAVPTLVSRLRRGGLVVYFRHAVTDVTQVDQRPVEFFNCGKQRNLSAEGRSQSRAIGEAFRSLGLPVGQVLSSPFCRALDTARLAFGRAESSEKLSFAMGAATHVKENAAEALRQLLSVPPASGTNRIIVSHTANLKDAAGIWPATEGIAIVFEPRGAEGFRAIAQVLPADWKIIMTVAADSDRVAGHGTKK